MGSPASHPNSPISGTHLDFTFPVLTRIPHFRYSPGFLLFRYSPRFYPFLVLTRTILRYSPGSHLSGTRPDFYFFGTRPYPTFPVLTRAILRYSPESYFFRYSPRFYLPNTRLDPTFSVPAQISTFSALAQIPPFWYSPGPFSGTRPDLTFPVLTWTLFWYSPKSHLFGTHLDFYFFGTFPDSTLSRYSPGFHLSLVLA